MMEINAVGFSARGFGRRLNFSIFGKLIFIIGLRSLRTELIIFGRRCSVCGLKIISI